MEMKDLINKKVIATTTDIVIGSHFEKGLIVEIDNEHVAILCLEKTWYDFTFITNIDKKEIKSFMKELGATWRKKKEKFELKLEPNEKVTLHNKEQIMNMLKFSKKS